MDLVQKNYTFGGLDLRSNDLTRNDTKCTDCSNVLLDRHRNLIKREGTKSLGIYGGTDLIYYSTDNKILAYSGSLVDPETNLFYPLQGTFPLPTNPSTIDYVEYNDIVYYTDNTGNFPLMKFDGFMVAKAGLPKTDSVVVGAGAATGFVRIAAYTIDLRGNYVWGDYTQISLAGTSGLLDLIWDSGLISSNQGKEHIDTYSKIATTAVLTAASNTAQIDAAFGHSYFGSTLNSDYVRVVDDNGDWHSLRVLSTTATSISLEIPVGINIPVTAGEPLESRIFIQVFTSANENFGYYTRNDSAFLFDMSNKEILTNKMASSGNPAVILTGANALDIPMEELFDTSVFRALPPKCKYLTLFNESLVLGNRRDRDTVFNQQSSYLHQSIYWSSIQLLQGGTSIENFPPENTTIIGNTGEGELSGLSGASDSLIIGKTRQIYFLNGVFQGSTYRIWSALTENIGIVSSKSIVTMAGMTIFMSEKGLYLTAKGSTPIKMADVLDPIFTSGNYDLTKTISAKDHITERLIFTLKGVGATLDRVLIYDYYYKQWFFWDGLSSDKGLVIKSDGATYFQGSVPVYSSSFVSKLDPTSLQDEFPNSPTTAAKVDYIASYSTNWFNFTVPSLKKKLTKISFLSTLQSNFNIDLKEQINWIDSDILTITDIPLGLQSPANDRKLAATKAFSFRLVLVSKRRENLSINGLELTFVEDQHLSKG